MAASSSTSDEKEDAVSGYSLVCSLSELQRLGRKRIILNERAVVLFHVKGQVYALDHFCYRKCYVLKY